MGRKRKVFAVLLIGIGLQVLLGPLFGFFTIAALLLLLIGMMRLRSGAMRQGYIFGGIGLGLLLLDHLMIVIGITLISLGWFYVRANKAHRGQPYRLKQGFITNVRYDREPWMMQSSSSWHAIGDIDCDLSLAIPDEAETVLYFQGILGDLDFSIPEDYGVEIEAYLLFGQIGFESNGYPVAERQQGIQNRLQWRSANYLTSTQKVKLVISYIAGDLNIRLFS